MSVASPVHTDPLAPLVEAVVAQVIPRVLAALRAERETPALVAVDAALGCSRRHAGVICRAGRIPGAVLVGRRWRSSQSGIDAYLASLRGARRRAVVREDDGDDSVTADSLLRALGWTP